MFMEYARDFVANLTRGGGDPFIRDTQVRFVVCGVGSTIPSFFDEFPAAIAKCVEIH